MNSIPKCTLNFIGRHGYTYATNRILKTDYVEYTTTYAKAWHQRAVKIILVC